MLKVYRSSLRVWCTYVETVQLYVFKCLRPEVDVEPEPCAKAIRECAFGGRELMKTYKRGRDFIHRLILRADQVFSSMDLVEVVLVVVVPLVRSHY